ncbi:MAG: DUF4126 domain-containing protein [Sideroxydans sp.]|nr:DUF4126 domain-containing protein [Sideroxydans sp.]
MDTISSVALAAGLGWASGLRLYATVFALGLLAKFGYVHLPAALDILSHPYLIALAGMLFVVEFFADKFPLVDSVWDSFHTFIRIPGGALLAMGAIDSSDPLIATSVALLGGTLAGGTHLAKSGSRALINTSPEPFSNWMASFSEEGLVVIGLWLALAHPTLFLVFIALFIILLFWLLPKLWRGIQMMFSVTRRQLR